MFWPLLIFVYETELNTIKSCHNWAWFSRCGGLWTANKLSAVRIYLQIVHLLWTNVISELKMRAIYVNLRFKLYNILFWYCGEIPLKPHTSLHSITWALIWAYKEACLHKRQHSVSFKEQAHTHTQTNK